MASKKLNSKLHQMMNLRKAGLDRHSGLNYVLWDLFCNIIAALNMNVYTWNSLMVNYVKKQERHFQNRRDTASIRGNLNKEFTRGNMTWKVFCKGLMFLQVSKFKISMDLTFANGRATHHEQTVTFHSVDPFLNEEEEDGAVITDSLAIVPTGNGLLTPLSSPQETLFPESDNAEELKTLFKPVEARVKVITTDDSIPW